MGDNNNYSQQLKYYKSFKELCGSERIGNLLTQDTECVTNGTPSYGFGKLPHLPTSGELEVFLSGDAVCEPFDSAIKKIEEVARELNIPLFEEADG